MDSADDGQERPPVARTGTVRLSYVTIVGFGAITIGGLLWMMLDPIVTQMLDVSAATTSTSTMETNREYLQAGWNAVPFLILVLFAISLLVRSITESQGV